MNLTFDIKDKEIKNRGTEENSEKHNVWSISPTSKQQNKI